MSASRTCSGSISGWSRPTARLWASASAIWNLLVNLSIRMACTPSGECGLTLYLVKWGLRGVLSSAKAKRGGLFGPPPCRFRCDFTVSASDLDAARFVLLAPGNPEREYAVVEMRLDLAVVQLPAEAESALVAVAANLRGRRLRFRRQFHFDIALDGEDVVVHLDVQTVRRNAGHVRRQRDAILVFDDIHRGQHDVLLTGIAHVLTLFGGFQFLFPGAHYAASSSFRDLTRSEEHTSELQSRRHLV